MEDRVVEVEYPVALEPKEDDMRHLTNDTLEMPKTNDMRHLTNDVLEMPQVDDMRRLTNDVLEMEYPVVEEHIVEFHEIFEEGQANREESGNDRRLYCKYCGKNFKSHNYVKMHERWHRGELSHHCPECNRAFRYPSELKKHTTIHTGQLPYKCEDCDLRFNKAQAAHEHRLRDHVGMNAAQDSKPLQPPIIFQMNNNYQPMSFEVVLPNLHTQTQGGESELERGNDPLTEGFSADCYPRLASMPRSSVIKPNYSYGKEFKELNYADRQELRWEEDMQLGRDYGSNAAIEDGGEATDVEQFMEDVDKNDGGHVHIEKPNMEECSKCRRIMEYENEIARLRNHHCAHN